MSYLVTSEMKKRICEYRRKRGYRKLGRKKGYQRCFLIWECKKGKFEETCKLTGYRLGKPRKRG